MGADPEGYQTDPEGYRQILKDNRQILKDMSQTCVQTGACGPPEGPWSPQSGQAGSGSYMPTWLKPSK